jgi:uncharacterized membrane protein
MMLLKKRLLLAFLLAWIQCTLHAQLFIKNNAPYPVKVVVGYFVPKTGKWASQGWFNVENGESINMLDFNLSYNRYYYYYALDDDGTYWMGAKDCEKCSFLIHPTQNFHIYTTDKTIGYEWKKFRMIDAENKKTFTLTLGGMDWWTGDCKNGYGTYKWVTDSKKYTGYWKNGVRQGKGSCEYGKYNTTFAGCKYDGDWNNNEWTNGTLTWANGASYTGTFSNAKRNGNGTLTYSEGSVYKGNWLDNKRHGQGNMNWKQDDKSYTGNWANDLREGQGQATYGPKNKTLANCKFVGLWENDTWKNGTLTYADGSKYVGYFRALKKHGEGKLYDKNGTVLKTGQWVDDQLVTQNVLVPTITWDAPMEAKITTTVANFEVKACIKGQNLTSVKVYLNNQPVGLERGWTTETNCSQSVQTTVVLNEGVNTVHIIAINQAGKTPSELRTIVYQKSKTPNPSPISNSNSNYYALILSVQDYTNVGITNLENPISDGEKLKNILTERYTFAPANITQLKNPIKKDIVLAIEQLQKKLTKNDYLLIFYSGHGTMQGEEGYWLPADADMNTTYHWFSSSELNTCIKQFKAKHILLIADACYSGTFLMRDFDAGNAMNEQSCLTLDEKMSRYAMTSGAKTQVPDKSVFLSYLIKKLQENALDCISAEQIYMDIKKPVIFNSPNKQIPQFGDIPLTGNEGGGFIFKLK